jgi:3-hydroxybutyryl-CoA dehydrogenase
MYRNVAVIGAGTMGDGLALVHALGGATVSVTDVNRDTLDRAAGMIGAAFDVLAQSGEIEAGTPHPLERIRFVPSLEEAVAGADYIVEAVVENPEVKRSIFAELELLAPRAAVIASNTSNLDIFPLVPVGLLPRTLIVHWYAPPYIVDLVDIVASPLADPSLAESVRAFVGAMGKHPIVLKRFVPGYIANRLQAAWTREVLWMIDQGIADAADIDASIRHGLAGRLTLLGHVMKSDFGGLGLTQRLVANASYEPPPRVDHYNVLDRLVAEGSTGVLAGRGFFDYSGRPTAELLADRDRRLIALKRSARDIVGSFPDPADQ